MESDNEYKIKGPGPRAIVQWVKDNHGEEGVARLWDVLHPATQKMVEEGPLVTNWYPLPVFEEFVAAADRILGSGDLSVAYEMGKFSAYYGMKTVYKIFLKVGSPEFVLKKSANIWSRYFNRGRMQAQQIEDKHWILELHDFDYTSEVFCPRVTGWIQGVADLSGAKQGQVSHTNCRCKGDPNCIWTLRWS